jgi:hypothetical protein
VAERLTNIELRLDDLEAKLEERHRANGGAVARRTRKANTAEEQS